MSKTAREIELEEKVAAGLRRELIHLNRAFRAEKKLGIAVKALKELSNETLVTAGGGCYANTAYDRAQKALAKIKEIEG